MSKRLPIYFLTLLAIAFSCKKIEPPVDPSEANDPIYHLKGIVDGDSLNLIVDDSTVFISEAPYNLNGIEAYSSIISDAENDFSLKMVLVRPEVFIDEKGVKLIDSKSLDFLIHEPICKRFSFLQGSNQADSIDISIDGVSTSGNQMSFKEFGKYIAEVNFSNYGNVKYNLPIEVGFKYEEINPYFSISAAFDTLILKSKDPNFEHEWKIDDVLVSNNNSDEIVVSSGIHKITHTITDDFGNQATHIQLVHFYNSHLNWYMDDSYCSAPTAINNYGRVFIEVDSKGEKYTSAYNMVNSTRKLDVTNVEYVVSESTQKIEFIKFNISFDAELKSLDNSKTMNLVNMKGVFHIAID